MGKILTFPLQWVVTRFLSQNSTVKKPLTYFHLGFKIRHSWVDSLFLWQNVRHLTNIFLKLVFPPPPLFEIANLFTISRFPLNGFPPSLFSKSKQFDSQFFIGNLRSPQKSCMRNSKRMRSSSNKYCTDQLFKKKNIYLLYSNVISLQPDTKAPSGWPKAVACVHATAIKATSSAEGHSKALCSFVPLFPSPELEVDRSDKALALRALSSRVPDCTLPCQKKSLQEWSTGKLPFKVKPI